ncbi:zeta toxin family protein [Streptomyces sp. NPDC007971]|uniref:zeta toxin family protein n=1 Tax=Streptomyces sp. NPDC007971 TaxID=3364799 RepID=UPI0036E743FA
MNENDELLYLILEQDIEEYEQTWWQNEPRVAKMCDLIPGLHAKLESITEPDIVGTEDVYRHEEIWHDDRLPDQTSARVRLPDPKARSQQASVFILSGIPGAGKTSQLVPLARKYQTAHGTSQYSLVTLCADDVGAALPEYASGLGASVVHEEACYITYEGDHPRARKCTADVAIDSIGRPAHMADYIRDWSAVGRKVHMLVAVCNVDVAIDRMKRRAIETGRRVPQRVIESAAVDVQTVVDAIKDGNWDVPSWIIVDTSSDGELSTVARTDDWAFAP